LRKLKSDPNILALEIVALWEKMLILESKLIKLGVNITLLDLKENLLIKYLLRLGWFPDQPVKKKKAFPIGLFSVKFLNNDENGWLLIRITFNDPIKQINIEADIKGGVLLIRNKLNKILFAFKQL